MEDLAVKFAVVKDESTYERDGTLSRVKRYTFFIGKYGPFDERVPLEQAADSSEITRRVEALKTKLRTLPQ